MFFISFFTDKHKRTNKVKSVHIRTRNGQEGKIAKICEAQTHRKPLFYKALSVAPREGFEPPTN